MSKNEHTVKIIRVNADADFDLPEYATPGSAGMDLRACIKESVVLKPMERALIPSGIAVSTGDPGIVAIVAARSGLSVKHGVALVNGIGVVDSDYTGEIKVGLINLSNESYEIKPMERVAQLLFMPVEKVRLLLVDRLDETERGSGGFGSTGRE